MFMNQFGDIGKSRKNNMKNSKLSWFSSIWEGQYKTNTTLGNAHVHHLSRKIVREQKLISGTVYLRILVDLMYKSNSILS